MAESGGAMKWLKWGCLGCATLIVLAAIAIGLVLWIASSGAQNEQVRDQTLTPDLPMPVTRVAPPVDPGADPTTSETATETDAVAETSFRAGRVEIDIAGAECRVHPAKPGAPLRVEASYDDSGYVLTETTTQDEVAGWTYRVEFRSKGGALFAGLRQLFGGTPPKIDVYLPRDVRIDLDARQAQGPMEVDLSGLNLHDTRLEVRQGAMLLGIDEPMVEPMRSLDVDASMGAFVAGGLSLASPAELDIKMSMGGAEVDLRGAWSNDAKIRISASRGGMQVSLPDGVYLKNVPGRQDGGPEGAPMLEFEVETQSGAEIEFD